MTHRYGDFVLDRPPLRTTTLLLWFGPALMLAIGALAPSSSSCDGAAACCRRARARRRRDDHRRPTTPSGAKARASAAEADRPHPDLRPRASPRRKPACCS